MADISNEFEELAGVSSFIQHVVRRLSPTDILNYVQKMISCSLKQLTLLTKDGNKEQELENVSSIFNLLEVGVDLPTPVNFQKKK